MRVCVLCVLLFDGVPVTAAALRLWKKPTDINPASWQSRRCGKEMWTYVVTKLTSFFVLGGLCQQEVRREARRSWRWWEKRQENCAGGGRGEERNWNPFLGREEGGSVWNMKPWEVGGQGGGQGGDVGELMWGKGKWNRLEAMVVGGAWLGGRWNFIILVSASWAGVDLLPTTQWWTPPWLSASIFSLAASPGKGGH